MDESGTAGAPVEAGAEGQGTGESQQGSIFEPYLQSVPDGWDSPPTGSPREIVSGYLKDAEKNVNQRLSDAADLQKQFGDYKDIDLSGVEPQQLSEVLQFVQQVGSSPEAYQEWLRNEAEAAGILGQQAVEGEPEEQDLETYVQSRIDAALNPVTQQLSQFEHSNQERQQAETQAAMETHITQTLGSLEKANNLKLNDEQQEAVLALGEQVSSNDWVEKGFAKYQALTGQAQASLVNDKAGQPAPSLRSGGQAAPPQGKTFSDVREQAIELMNQAM